MSPVWREIDSLRSVLYAPGNRPDLIRKSPRFGADAICLVLEDSVPEKSKADARSITRECIAELADLGQIVLVKVNPVGHGGIEDDLAAIVSSDLAGIILPKVQSADDVRCVDSLLTSLEEEVGCIAGHVGILGLIETSLALVRAFEIAGASPRMRGLMSGTVAGGDMARDVGFRWTAEGLERLYLRSAVLVSARAAGLNSSMDGAFGSVDDRDGLTAEAEFARQLGYRGKVVVHPSHVAIVNEVFSPTEEEIAFHARVIEAFDEAIERDSAAAVVDGQFIDYAMAATARQQIDLAERVGTRRANP